MQPALRVLLIEDDDGDALLIREFLERSGEGVELSRAGRLSACVEMLGQAAFDVVLLDLGLPDCQGLDTLVRALPAARGVPIIVMTGLDDRQTSIRAVQEGAQDYLTKGTVTADLLLKAMHYGIERNRIQREKERLIAELRHALEKVRTLSGMLPICAWCKKVRDDTGYWEQIEKYISNHSGALFTHSICPECMTKVGGEIEGLRDRLGRT